MSLLSRLFGGGGDKPAEAESETYQGFTITPDAQRAEHAYRIGAVIEKDGKRHEMIRADTFSDAEAAQQASVTKARQLIDQMGMRLFSM